MSNDEDTSEWTRVMPSTDIPEGDESIRWVSYPGERIFESLQVCESPSRPDSLYLNVSSPSLSGGVDVKKLPEVRSSLPEV